MAEPDLEALEAELWELRSKEYDVSVIARELETIQLAYKEAKDVLELCQSRENLVRKQLDELHIKHKKLEDDYQTLFDAKDKAVAEAAHLTRRLEAIEQAEYMHSTYNFEVTDKLPVKRPGWRLTR